MHRVIIFVLICAVLLNGCVAPIVSGVPSPPEVTALAPMTVCYVNGASSHIAVLYAFEKGMFQKHGLSVNLVAMGSGSKAGAALIAGEFDMCLMSGSSIINGVAAGADTVIIGGLFNTQLYSLVVAAEIKTADDLKGKVLAINQPGGATDIVMRAALNELGLRPESDVQVLSIGGQGERMAAMDAGQVVGTLVTVPESAKSIEKGYHELLDISTLELPAAYVTVSTRRSYLEANRDQALQFMRALTEAIAAMKEDRDGTVATLAQYMLLDPVTDATSLEAAYTNLVQKNIVAIPYPTSEGIQAEIEALASENPRVAALTPEMVMDTSLVRELEESGWFEQLYE
jgi:NitT/TauT family transport system substrate-binding protein